MEVQDHCFSAKIRPFPEELAKDASISVDYFPSLILHHRLIDLLPRRTATFPDSKGNAEMGTQASDETTPLLRSIEPAPISEASGQTPADNEDAIQERTDEDEQAPLPKAQIFLLCYTSVVEPIAFFGIFPYINSMIEIVGNVEKDEVGFYSGLIESLFSATQMCVMLLWGKVNTHTGTVYLQF